MIYSLKEGGPLFFRDEYVDIQTAGLRKYAAIELEAVSEELGVTVLYDFILRDYGLNPLRLCNHRLKICECGRYAF